MSLHPASRYWASFSLFELVEDVCRPLEACMAEQAVVPIIDIPHDQRVTANRESLTRAVRNLVLNSIDAMPAGGGLFITSADGPHALELEIADTGPSMLEEEISHAFDVVTSAQRDGTGWGLAVVRQIAESHGGQVMAANCPDGGVAFTLKLPHASALEAAA